MWDMLTWIDGTAMAEEIRISLWLFPALEIAHVAAIAIVLGSIACVDLRLAGLASRDRSITDVSREMLPWTWAGFALATLFGVLLFVGQPLRYVEVAFFDAKIILILLAGLNMLVFEHLTRRGIGRWDREPIPPLEVRIAGGLSLAFWISVVICGRFIGFV
jgi:Family of unknown function (DUF6644)